MKKKLFAAVVVTMLLCVFFAVNAMAYTLYTAVSSGTVYLEADSSSEKIGSVSRGQEVAVEKFQGSWARVIWGSWGTGYIKTKHLKTGDDKVSTTTYYATENGVHVRSEASSSSSKLGSLNRGTKAHVVKISGGWAKITWNGGYGYVKSKLISRTKPGSSSSSSSTKKTTESMEDVFKGFKSANYHAVVTPIKSSSYVNLRWGPSTSTRIAGVRYAGQVLKVIAQSNDWCQVADEKTGEVGYMMRRFLVEVPEEVLQTVTNENGEVVEVEG